MVVVLAGVHKRILSCFTTQFEFDEDFTHDYIDEGKAILARERRKMSGLDVPSDIEVTEAKSGFQRATRRGAFSLCFFFPAAQAAPLCS